MSRMGFWTSRIGCSLQDGQYRLQDERLGCRINRKDEQDRLHDEQDKLQDEQDRM
jgi:hypothetical protein